VGGRHATGKHRLGGRRSCRPLSEQAAKNLRAGRPPRGERWVRRRKKKKARGSDTSLSERACAGGEGGERCSKNGSPPAAIRPAVQGSLFHPCIHPWCGTPAGLGELTADRRLKTLANARPSKLSDISQGGPDCRPAACSWDRGPAAGRTLLAQCNVEGECGQLSCPRSSTNVPA